MPPPPAGDRRLAAARRSARRRLGHRLQTAGRGAPGRAQPRARPRARALESAPGPAPGWPHDMSVETFLQSARAPARGRLAPAAQPIDRGPCHAALCSCSRHACAPCSSASGTTTEDSIRLDRQRHCAGGHRRADADRDELRRSPTGAGGCSAPLAVCGDACIDLAYDPAHCGGCDQPCDPGARLSRGPVQRRLRLRLARSATAPASTSTSTPPTAASAATPALTASPASPARCVPDCEARPDPVRRGLRRPRQRRGPLRRLRQSCPSGQPCVYGQCVGVGLHHLLISGQSLSTGSGARGRRHGAAVHQNVSFNTGVRAGGVNLTGFIPLVETWNGGEGETIASGAANLVSRARAGPRRLLTQAPRLRPRRRRSAVRRAQEGHRAVRQRPGPGHRRRRPGRGHERRDRTRCGRSPSSTARATTSAATWPTPRTCWPGRATTRPTCRRSPAKPLPGADVPVSRCRAGPCIGSAVSRIPGEQLAAARDPARPDLRRRPQVHPALRRRRPPHRRGLALARRVLRQGLPHGADRRPAVASRSAPRSITRAGTVITVRFRRARPAARARRPPSSPTRQLRLRVHRHQRRRPAITAVALAGAHHACSITLAAEPVGGNHARPLRRHRHPRRVGAARPPARAATCATPTPPSSRHGYSLQQLGRPLRRTGAVTGARLPRILRAAHRLNLGTDRRRVARPSAASLAARACTHLARLPRPPMPRSTCRECSSSTTKSRCAPASRYALTREG